MTHRSPFPRLLLALLAIAFVPRFAAADDPLATLRIDSLDAAMGDVEIVAGALGMPIDREGLTGQGLSPFGLSGGQWLDRSKPIAVALPMQGMTMGLQDMDS